jgi:hypothetical protein
VDHENAIENNEVAQPDAGMSAEEQIRRLREENVRLWEEIAQLTAERDDYLRSLYAWEKEKLAAEPLPPEDPSDFQDIEPLLDELEQQWTERK